MSVDHPTDHRPRGPGGADNRADCSVSRPSKNNRHGPIQPGEPADSEIGPSELPDDVPALRPVAVKEGTTLRDEAVAVRTAEGYTVPVAGRDEVPEGEKIARPTYRVLNEFRSWYESYESAHIEYEKDGETSRTRLENSYQPEYGKRYYARLKDFERGIRRRWDDVTTTMLTFTASTENAKGFGRCPADHMREIAEGWRTVRKQLHKALSGYRWEYARVWEPHQSGYGHLHVAIFVDDHADQLEAETFEPVMNSYVSNVMPAGSEAHSLEEAVSLNREVENLGSYISEYLGVFGESITDRPVTEQMFYAISWATNTRRLDFSNGAQDIIAGEKFRRETGLRPEDRGVAGDSEAGESGAEPEEAAGDGEGWEAKAICYVKGRRPEYADPTTGGVASTEIDGRPGVDPPASR